MKSFHKYLTEYRKHLKKGDIRKAYKGLMEYIADLKLYLKNKYPDYFVSSSVNTGYMDYTYFFFFPKSLKKKKLKVIILFIHETFTFEVWLSGFNKNIQKKYWQICTKNKWNKYHIANTIKDDYYIIKNTLLEKTDFKNLKALTKQIEKGILKFIKDVESFLSKY